jgi:hypothetical protein
MSPGGLLSAGTGFCEGTGLCEDDDALGEAMDELGLVVGVAIPDEPAHPLSRSATTARAAYRRCLTGTVRFIALPPSPVRVRWESTCTGAPVRNR